MTLADKLLENLSDGRFTTGRHDVQAHDAESGWSGTLTLDRQDELSVLVWELRMSRETPLSDLKAWGDRIAANVQGLLEPIKLLEVDAGQQKALLRSETPTSRAGKLGYYEVILEGAKSLVLRRYQVAPGEKREQKAFALTNETLTHVIEDLI